MARRAALERYLRLLEQHAGPQWAEAAVPSGALREQAARLGDWAAWCAAVRRALARVDAQVRQVEAELREARGGLRREVQARGLERRWHLHDARSVPQGTGRLFASRSLPQATSIGG